MKGVTVHRTASRAGQRGTLAALAALLLLAWVGSPAQAADTYRYWSYWAGGADGSWSYSQSGPADRILSDGDVEGWLFLASADVTPTQQPTPAADFAAICTDGEPVPGQVRVAVVIDYGDAGIAPEGSTGQGAPQTACVTLPEGSTGEQAIAAAAEVRSEQGAVCGINGYPASGCFEIVAASTASADTDPVASGPARWVWLVGGLLAVVAAVAAVVLRSRKPPAA